MGSKFSRLKKEDETETLSVSLKNSQTSYFSLWLLVFLAFAVAVVRLALLGVMFYLAIDEHEKMLEETDMKEMIKKKNKRDSLVGPRGLAEYVIDISIALLIALFMTYVLIAVSFSKNDYVKTMMRLKGDAFKIFEDVKKITDGGAKAGTVIGTPLNLAGEFGNPLIQMFNPSKRKKK
jgi:hypothetical protein